MTLTPRQRRRRFVAMVLLLAIPLALLLSRVYGGFVRDVLAVPIDYLIWIVQLYVRAVPQVLFWGALILLGLALALTSVLVDGGVRGDSERDAGEGAALDRAYKGPVEQLTSQIHFAARSAYFRRSLARRLGRLMVQYVGHEEQYTVTQLEQTLDALDTPPEIKAFLREGTQPTLLSRRVGPVAWLRRRLWGHGEEGAHKPDLEQVVRFLEDRLEVS